MDAPPTPSLFLRFERDGRIRAFPVVGSDGQARDLARWLQRLAATLVENPSIAAEMAGAE
jgi:hypothetical protein